MTRALVWHVNDSRLVHDNNFTAVRELVLQNRCFRPTCVVKSSETNLFSAHDRRLRRVHDARSNAVKQFFSHRRLVRLGHPSRSRESRELLLQSSDESCAHTETLSAARLLPWRFAELSCEQAGTTSGRSNLVKQLLLQSTV